MAICFYYCLDCGWAGHMRETKSGPTRPTGREEFPYCCPVLCPTCMSERMAGMTDAGVAEFLLQRAKT